MAMKNRRRGVAPRDIIARQREVAALQLRIKGMSYAEIAEELDLNENQVGVIITRSIDRTVSPAANVVRALELQRLDALLSALWDAAMTGHLPTVDRVLKIMDRRSRYLGLDAPQKIAQTDTHGRDLPQLQMTDAQRGERLLELLAAAAAKRNIEASLTPSKWEVVDGDAEDSNG